jgi:hypothetical protein
MHDKPVYLLPHVTMTYAGRQGAWFYANKSYNWLESRPTNWTDKNALTASTWAWADLDGHAPNERRRKLQIEGLEPLLSLACWYELDRVW